MGLRNWLRRTTEEPPGDAEAPDTAPVSLVSACGDREKVRVRGTIRSVVSAPDGVPELRAELADASGVVQVVWLGRRAIPGIESGATILVEGRISCSEGVPIMYNPRYELTARS